MTKVISVDGLSKKFGRVLALDGVDLDVTEGEVHGFLGPNGAGKSTTIRVLLGMLRASSGTAQVFGMDAWRDAVSIHRRLAYVPGDVALWPNLTGGEAIDVLTRLRGGLAPAPERERLIDTFGLDVRRRCRTYSKGNRQKVALIAAFATPAELYLFDEPTSGLDPVMEMLFQQEVRRVTEEGAAVLLSSHILSEVEQLCDRVSIIRAGRIVDRGTLEELRHLHHSTVEYEGVPVAGLDGAQVEGTQVRGTVEPDALPGVLANLASQQVTALTVKPPSLEELFLRHYESDAGEAAPTMRQRGRHAKTD